MAASSLFKNRQTLVKLSPLMAIRGEQQRLEIPPCFKAPPKGVSRDLRMDAGLSKEYQRHSENCYSRKRTASVVTTKPQALLNTVRNKSGRTQLIYLDTGTEGRWLGSTHWLPSRNLNSVCNHRLMRYWNM